MAIPHNSSVTSTPGAPSPVTGPAPTMEEYPEQFTPTQLEARSILKHILHNLKDEGSKYYPRYGKWVTRHPRLEEFCFRCVRPRVWRFLEGRWNLDGLKLIGGDLKSEGRGIYFDGVLGLDRRTRIYIGQSTNLRFRISQHWNFRYRRDNPSLHYYAFQQSMFNIFGVLATLPSPSMGNHALPGMDCPDLLLNVLEMWMCLLFRGLSKDILAVWLPEGVAVEGEFGALNIALPLDYGAKERGWVDLTESDDPLVREYLGRDRRTVVGPVMSREDEGESKADKGVVVGTGMSAAGGQHVIYISGPGLLLFGTAVLAGYLFLRGGAGVRRR